jgi:hypothetical protein
LAIPQEPLHNCIDEAGDSDSCFSQGELLQIIFYAKQFLKNDYYIFQLRTIREIKPYQIVKNRKSDIHAPNKTQMIIKLEL